MPQLAPVPSAAASRPRRAPRAALRRLPGALALLALCLGAPASAQSISVLDAMTLPSTAGEAQSTIVPPGKKSQCPQGRFLVTNDTWRPPSAVVSGRNLDQTTGAPVTSTFNMGALAANFDAADLDKTRYFFGTNDHDLITLANGDVLYVTGAFSRMPLTPQGGRPLPIWMSSLLQNTARDLCTEWDSAAEKCTKTYPFGPNARTVVLTFRSTDCGQTFDFLSEMDPLRFEGGTCALPQFRAGTTDKPYDMGGTDGQTTRVDPTNNHLLMTFQCVGFNAVDTNKTDAVLDANNKLNKTLVLKSDNAGATWKSLGFINQAQWRFGVVPLPGNELAFGFASSVLTGKPVAGGKYTFDSTGVVANNGQWSWMGWWDFTGSPGIALTKDHANVFAMPVLTRTRDSKNVVLAFPDKFGAKGLGYRVYFYDRVKKSLAEAASILPVKPNASNVAFHLAAVEAGSGPVLLYWTDLDSATKKMTVRGRIITGHGEFTEDFTVSRVGQTDHSFALPAEYWIGDYHTAGGMVRKTGPVQGQGKFTVDLRTTRYDYYPMWIEADGNVHYTRVEYAVEPALLTTTNVKPKSVKVITVPEPHWKPQPPPVELSKLARPVKPERDGNVLRSPAVRRP